MVSPNIVIISFRVSVIILLKIKFNRFILSACTITLSLPKFQ